VRFTAADVVDQLGHGGIEMSILILVLVGKFFGRVVDMSDIDSCELKLLLQKLRQPLLEELFLILVLGDQLFEIRYFSILLLHLALLLLHPLPLPLYVAVKGF
jgi:hypothetical protein